MTVGSLFFQDYRNLKNGAFVPGKDVNILYGSNAQGKTNLIEAIWLFTGARSFRGSKDAELVTLGKEKAALSLSFEAGGREQRIRLSIGNGRRAELNGVSLESPVQLSGEFCAVIFSPEHLGLVKEGPDLRRKFLDAAICQLQPRYAAAVAEYRKSLSQRNALLKDIPQHADLLDTLDIWDERLCRTGARIVHTRLRYLERLSVKAAGIYEGIAGNGEELTLCYVGGEEAPYETGLSPDAVPGLYRELSDAMRKNRQRDIETGYTHAGPHRDDLQLFISSLPARTFGSQGQQRSVVLSLKLAEADVLRESLREPPVLLLDDVMSELDLNRRDYLLNHIEGIQVFITCCDPSSFQRLENGRAFEVKSGEVAV